MQSSRTLVVLVAAVAASGLLAWAALRGDSGPDGPDPVEAGGRVEQIGHIHGLEVPAWSGGRVLVATHEGLDRIEEDGAWRRVSEQAHDFMGFAANPAERDVLYSSGHPAPGADLVDPIGFMASEDGGRSWEPRSLQGEADFHAMAVDGSGEVVYGWEGAIDPGLYRSSDEGRTWERPEAAELAEAGDVAALAVHPEDPDQVLAATQTGLLRSQDAGASWEMALEEPTPTVAYDPADRDRLLAYSVSPERGLLESADAGATWTSLGLELDDDAAGHIAVDPTDPEVIYVGTFASTLLRTADGGETWEELATDGAVAAAS